MQIFQEYEKIKQQTLLSELQESDICYQHKLILSDMQVSSKIHVWKARARDILTDWWLHV